jgi:hypothetical protein
MAQVKGDNYRNKRSKRVEKMALILVFCGWRGGPTKEVGRRVKAREMALLGRWLGDGLPSWGKVRTHLDQVIPFRGSSLDGGC